MMSETKMELSKELEQFFFRSVLKRREIEALRARCENYQLQSAPQWSPGLFQSYSQYFGFLSALKIRSALFELAYRGYLKSLMGKKIQLLDFGAGTLGGSLGAVDFLQTQNIQVETLLAVDKDLDPVQWSAREFKDFLPKIQTSQHLPKSLKPGTLFIAVDVLNELQTWDSMVQLIKTIPEDSLFVLIEPASKAHNQRLLQMRDEILPQLPKGVSLLLPCTHSMSCPALPVGEWCHEERDYKAPSVYWNLVHEMGFRRSRLAFSLLSFGSQESAFRPTDARVVSQILRPKGRCEKWLCSQGRRWKLSMLQRKRSDENAFVYDAKRGDVLDCLSTGISAGD